MQDKRELEKFIKLFVFKTPQVIVQSRLGEKIQTSADPQSSNWVGAIVTVDLTGKITTTRPAAPYVPMWPDVHCVDALLRKSRVHVSYSS